MDRKKKILVQTCICLGIFAVLQAGIHPSAENADKFWKKIEKAVRKNYTLAELLQIGQEAAETVASAPSKVNEAVLKANEKVQYGKPFDENSSEAVQPVYAVAGGKVLRAGIRNDIGMYIMIEHPVKISTYGHLCNAAVITGDRVKKGDLIGSYDAQGEKQFYFSLEDKTGNVE